jgi:hypothetical protein
VSQPLAVKEVTIHPPTATPVVSGTVAQEPKVGVRPPALVGLSTAQAVDGSSDPDPVAKKKKPKKKKKTAAAEVGSVDSESPEAVDGPKPVAVPSVAPVLTPEERRAKLETLTAEDKLSLAAEWGPGVDAQKFETVMRSDQRYQYFRQLTPDERAFVSLKQIEKRQKPPAADVAKHALQQRLRSLATIIPADLAHLEETWGMPRSAPQFKAAMSKEESYQMFRQLPRELRTIVSATRIKKGTLLDEAELIAARAKREEIRQAEAEALAAEQALAKNQVKLAASKAAFEKTAKELRIRIAARVKAEIPDFVWEEEFDKSVEATRGKVAQGALAAKQGKQVSDKWDSAIDEAKKVRDVTAAAANFARLHPSTLNEIKTDVLADTTQTVTDFVERARTALSAQRNPTDLETWKSWMQLTMYPKYKSLGAQEGFAVHFTVAANSLSLPALVTDATTPAQLLNSLFRAPSGEKMDEAHVSLETGITDAEGRPKNPHKYWRDGPTEYELYFGKGADRSPRWGADTDEADVKAALDAAMKEAYDALLERAEHVLERAGRL